MKVLTAGAGLGTTSTVEVAANGVVAYSDTNAEADVTGLAREQFTHTFVATGATTTLTVLNSGPATDLENGPDDVWLTTSTRHGPAPCQRWRL